MAQRGRGTLEIKPSSNPFFQTTQSACVPKQVVWDSPELSRNFLETKQAMDQDDVMGETKQEATPETREQSFAFLYTRTSDSIGKGVIKSSAPPVVNRGPSHAEFLRERNLTRKALAASDAAEQAAMNSAPKPTTEQILASFVHKSKPEDPRYSTSSNDIGKMEPTMATFVKDRCGRPQGFSNSFNNIKPENTSLNTGVTRSTVHPRLDPQFA